MTCGLERLSCLLLVMAGSAALAPAQQGAPSKEGESGPRTGVVTLRFDERHPLSALEKIEERLGWTEAFIAQHDEMKGRYDLTGESFAAFVPRDYDPKEKYALLVFISPMKQAWMDPEWVPVMERLGVIGITPVNAGNDRCVWYRIGLALDAVHNMSKRYAIDPERVWIGGGSGGGRVAATLAFHYPDVFRGSYPMAGVNWYGDVAVPGGKGRVWAAQIPRPPESRLRLARMRRHVIMAGENDLNRDQARGVFELMTRKERFRHVLWQEVPELGHAAAPADWFEKGLRFLAGEDAGSAK